MHERDRNVRNLRQLRRAGGDEDGAHLVERNAELTAALLSRRPHPAAATDVEDAPGFRAPTPPTGGDDEVTQPFATPEAATAPAVSLARPAS